MEIANITYPDIEFLSGCMGKEETMIEGEIGLLIGIGLLFISGFTVLLVIAHLFGIDLW